VKDGDAVVLELFVMACTLRIACEAPNSAADFPDETRP
jgi:hypothetical protein